MVASVTPSSASALAMSMLPSLRRARSLERVQLPGASPSAPRRHPQWLTSRSSATRPLTVEVVEVNEADFLPSGGLAKLSGWLGGAEAEQSRGLGTRLTVADE